MANAVMALLHWLVKNLAITKPIKAQCTNQNHCHCHFQCKCHFTSCYGYDEPSCSWSMLINQLRRSSASMTPWRTEVPVHCTIFSPTCLKMLLQNNGELHIATWAVSHFFLLRGKFVGKYQKLPGKRENMTIETIQNWRLLTYYISEWLADCIVG